MVEEALTLDKEPQYEDYKRAILCPISYSIFKDPVIASDGFTYEYSIIVKILKTTCRSPMTRKPLTYVLRRDNTMIETINFWMALFPMWESEKFLIDYNHFKHYIRNCQQINFLLENIDSYQLKKINNEDLEVLLKYSNIDQLKKFIFLICNEGEPVFNTDILLKICTYLNDFKRFLILDFFFRNEFEINLDRFLIEHIMEHFSNLTINFLFKMFDKKDNLGKIIFTSDKILSLFINNRQSHFLEQSFYQIDIFYKYRRFLSYNYLIQPELIKWSKSAVKHISEQNFPTLKKEDTYRKIEKIMSVIINDNKVYT